MAAFDALQLRDGRPSSPGPMCQEESAQNPHLGIRKAFVLWVFRDSLSDSRSFLPSVLGGVSNDSALSSRPGGSVVASSIVAPHSVASEPLDRLEGRLHSRWLTLLLYFCAWRMFSVLSLRNVV